MTNLEKGVCLMVLRLYKPTGMLLFRTLVVCSFLSSWFDELKRFSKVLGTDLSISFQVFSRIP